MNISTECIEQLHNREDSRILIFVKEVEFAHYLAKILQQHDFSAASLVGTSCSTHHETMKCSLSEMTTLLDKFKNGDLRVIVATTVLEEGLDVALCNMVISYGHVTNETAMIQRRGRARAENSRYILILPHMLAWMEKKERINEFRRNKMMQVVETLQVEDPVFLEFITNYQQENFFENKPKIENANESSGQWKFVCKECQTTVCFDEEIRLVDNAHRVIIDPTKLLQFRVVHKPPVRRGKDGIYANAGKIFCYKCNNKQIGNRVLYKELPFFQLKIDMCNVVNTNTSESRCLKSWKEFVPLHKAPPINFLTELPEYQKKLNFS